MTAGNRRPGAETTVTDGRPDVVTADVRARAVHALHAAPASGPPQVNDFSLSIATVNGTGSASANALLARAMFRMGLPISAKNLLPSNIQGMATWYEIRVDPAGHMARTRGHHLVVAMNSQTFAGDVAGCAPGGYVLYDSSGGLPEGSRRGDCTYLGVPLARLVTATFDDPSRRVQLRNIAYVGAVSALLAVDPEVVVAILAERFGRREGQLQANERAFELGYDDALARLDCPLPFRVARVHPDGDRILVDGNTATALGCLYAGATIAAWYPITPATSVMDNFSALCARYRRVPDPTAPAAAPTARVADPTAPAAAPPARARGEEATDPTRAAGLDCPEGYRNDYLILQAEDELAAIGMVIGASWNGARAFTSTSGPGLSLMGELLGLAYYAEIPTVVFDVQRSGPSTGMPTRTQQADLLEAAYASHGDTKHLLLFPADPKECFEFAVAAFDHAERFQTPVLVLSDFDIGSNDWVVPRLEWDDGYVPDRGRVLSAPELEVLARFARYADWDDDFVAARTLPGVHPKGAYFTRGSGHDSLAGYTEAPDRYEEVVDRLAKKHAAAARHLPAPVTEHQEGARAGVLTIGSCDAAVREAIEHLAAAGTPLDYLRVRSFPFQAEVRSFIDAHERCVVVEQNRDGRLRAMLAVETGAPIEGLGSVRLYGGLPPTAEEVGDGIVAALGV
jgi:2-oxoglutarate ferredoxin oxidoreductase subunit alpha